MVTTQIPNTWTEVEAYMRHHFQEYSDGGKNDYRLGQAYFNALYEIYPEVAELVRGTLDDPFYTGKQIGDQAMARFFDAIMPYFVSKET